MQIGIGFTDLCKSDAGMDHQISTNAIDIPAFRSKIERYLPNAIAFTSKKAASLFYNRPTKAVVYGRQQLEKGFPDVFVLSSPSGAASSYWTLQPWRELADWIR
jgi:TDG/mug DNA glycosylase family protein